MKPDGEILHHHVYYENGNREIMGLLKHREDLANFLRGWTCFPILLLPAITGVPDHPLSIMYGLFVWFLLNDMNFILHQHVHLPMTNSRFHNISLDWLMSFVTFMCAYSWRQQHVLRHHASDDSWGKASKWEYEKDTFIRSTVYSMKKSAAMYWFPLKEAVTKSLVKPAIEPLNYRTAFLQYVATHIVAILLIAIEPYFYIPYYFFVYFFTTKADYDNHVGCDESEYGFSNNTLSLTYNIVRNNFGYHTAHHYYPKAHWTELPSLHKKICHKIPPKFISQKIWTGFWTPPLVVHAIMLIRMKIANAMSPEVTKNNNNELPNHIYERSKYRE